MVTPSPVLGATVSSPAHAELTEEAVGRFWKVSGLNAVTLRSTTEPGFGAKLNLDLHNGNLGQISGLHAASVGVAEKLEALRQQAAIFGSPQSHRT